MTRCPFCRAAIQWYKTPKGHKIAVYVDAREDGALMVLPDGTIDRHHGWASEPRLRSHLLDCKPLRDSLYKKSYIVIGKDNTDKCEYEGCERTDKHFHCYRCGSTKHFADACDEDDERILEALRY